MRRLILAAALAWSVAGCGGSSRPEVLSKAFEVKGEPTVDVTVTIQPEHLRQAPRYLAGAILALRTVDAVRLRFPRRSLAIIDPAWQTAPATDRSTIIMERTPWWSAATSMTPELAAARAVVRAFWTERCDTRRLPTWFVDGLAEYLARRSVEPLFASENNPPGYAWVELRYFDRFMPRFLRARLLTGSDGDPIPAYRAKPRVDPTRSHDGVDERSLVAKSALTLTMLERWVSRPVSDAILAEFARRFSGRQPTLADFVDVSSDVSGQDLKWLLVQTLDGSAVFDYGVDALATGVSADGGFDTTVDVARHGDGQFTGATAPRDGPFESGRGVILRVRFADAAQTDVAWDGRDVEKTFRFHSVAPAISAEIDPEALVALDLNRTNNSLTLRSATAVAARRWTARWAIWLQDTLLTSAFFAWGLHP